MEKGFSNPCDQTKSSQKHRDSIHLPNGANFIING